MKQKVEQAFFSLLRISLWQGNEDLSIFENLSSDHWEQIYETAKSQALLAVIYDGVNSLPKGLMPDKKLLIKWFVNSGKVEKSNIVIDNILQEFSSKIKKENIQFILIKGQGLASLYPSPLHRQCGDIDIVVNDKSKYQELYQLMCSYTDSKPLFRVKHVSFDYCGTNIEIHKNIMNLHNPFRINKVNKFIDHIIERDGYDYYQSGNESIKLLPHTINAVYILKHAFDHLVTFGVGLRQVCDWTIFIKTYKDKLDKKEITHLLKLCSLHEAANMFAYISINYLGLSVDDIPFEYHENKKQGEFLYNDILSGGNFGTFRKGYSVNKNAVLRRTNTALTIFKRSIKFIKFSPTETLWYPLMQIYKVSLSLLRIEA